MSESGLLIIKTVCQLLAGTFAVLAAVFYFLEKWQQGQEAKTRAWFREKWQAIRSSRWRAMPETAIGWLVDVGLALGLWVFRPLAERKIILPCMFLILYGVLVPVGIWFKWAWFGAAAAVLICWPLTLYDVARTLDWAVFRRPCRFIAGYIEKREAQIEVWYLLGRGVVSVISGVIWLFKIMTLDIGYATLVMFALAFVFWLPLLLPAALIVLLGATAMGRDKEKCRHFVILFGVGTSFSFFATLLALLLGHVTCPELWVPQTVQMLFSNVICDGFTLVATFCFLRWAIAKRPLARIPLAILGDVFVAAVLACLSLYFGLVFTERALSVRQVLYVLMGNAPGGAGVEFGPYFWAMHTTFIPTLLYLMLIGVCWMAKAMLTVAEKFTARALEHEKPLGLTAALFGIFCAVFTPAWMAIGAAEQRRDKPAKVQERSNKIVEVNDVRPQ